MSSNVQESIQSVRERKENLELDLLSPFAARASESRGRIKEDACCDVRTVYERDMGASCIHCPFASCGIRCLIPKRYVAPDGTCTVRRLCGGDDRQRIRFDTDLIGRLRSGMTWGTPFGHAVEATLPAE